MLQSNLVRYALTGIAAVALAWSAPALAQDAEPAADAEDSPVGIEEITVTAEKREATLQDTAIAVTAFTAEDLENLNMLETRDLANFTPGLTLTTFSNPTYAQAILRGIGQGDFHPLYQSRVGFYLDGVYVGNQSGISSTLLDIDRIEVLRGPQGTLYGRNTIGGAINMVTRRPSGDFGGKVQVGVGNYGLRELRGSVDFPILPERLSGRISYYNGKRDPYEDSYQAVCNSPTGCGFDPLAGDWETVKGPDIWDMDRWAVTGQLSWTPNDRLTVDYTFNHFELEEGMIPEWMTDF
ncbi:MAG: TonB-dependent receptor plug domain-containing protein, partial [Proteobacteria bacterium]|nr:TonB-dependent receptor plug domain-containing protein [Pseudomonadota bacterium]